MALLMPLFHHHMIVFDSSREYCTLPLSIDQASFMPCCCCVSNPLDIIWIAALRRRDQTKRILIYHFGTCHPPGTYSV